MKATAFPLETAFDPFLEEGQLSGAVLWVHGKPGSTQCFARGYADLETQRPMTLDTLFWVASVTKPVTAAAILTLMEAGHLDLDDPLNRFLPEFGNLWLQAEASDHRQTLIRPSRAPSIRELLNHTHGLTDPQPLPRINSLRAWVSACSLLPMRHDPGTRWVYTQIGMSALGAIVEEITHMPFERYLQETFFAPLGMSDTTFTPTPEQWQRSALPYIRDAQTGKLRRHRYDFLDAAVASPPLRIMPAGGLFSTAPDLDRFFSMLLRGGERKGHRYLKTETLREMTRPQTGNLVTGFREGSDGLAWGLGVSVVQTPGGNSAHLSPGTWGHDGAFGNGVICDPSRDLLMIMMIQRAGLDPMRDTLNFKQTFIQACLAAETQNPL